MTTSCIVCAWAGEYACTCEDDEDGFKAIEDAVDHFAEAMKKKLAKKHSEGWDGWRTLPVKDLQDKAVDHFVRLLRGGEEQDVDVANFMMFLFYRRN